MTEMVQQNQIQQKLKLKLSDDMVMYLAQNYIEMRSQSAGKNTITATPRQLESIIRLSEAMARVRFSDTIIKEDIEEALRLIKVATQQAATDPMTGVIDMDLIQTGVSANTRQNLTKLVDIIQSIMKDNEEVARKGVKLNSINEEVKRRINILGQSSFNFTEFELREALKILEDDGFVAIVGNRKAPTIRYIAVD